MLCCEKCHSCSLFILITHRKKARVSNTATATPILQSQSILLQCCELSKCAAQLFSSIIQIWRATTHWNTIHILLKLIGKGKLIV